MIMILSDDDKSVLLESLVHSQKVKVNFLLILIGSTDNPLFGRLQLAVSDSLWLVPKKRWLGLNQLVQLFKVFKEHADQTIFASGYVAHTTGILLGFFTRKTKRIYIRHFVASHRNIRHLNWFFLDLLINSLATRIVAVSPLLRDYLHRMEYVRSSKITVIVNCVDTKRLLSIRQQRMSRKSLRPDVILVARQTSGKGLLFAIQAFKSFFCLCPHAVLQIYGQYGDMTAEMKTLLSDLPVGSYNFHGKQHDLGDIYSRASILIHVPESKLSESFGLVFVEGLISGLQCVFTEAGILNGRNGTFSKEHVWYVDFKNSEQIFQAMTQILLENRLKSLAPINQFGEFTIDSVIKEYEKELR